MKHDGLIKGVVPDLSKLPKHIREQMHKPIPLRPHEVHAKVRLFKSVALNQPNGRLMVTHHIEDEGSPNPKPLDSIQIDLVDFTAKEPLASSVIHRSAVPEMLKGLLQAYLKVGGTMEELKDLFPQDTMPPLMNNPLFYEEDGSNE